ncbi:MAG: hypothetical protein V1770_01105 [bacterium]
MDKKRLTAKEIIEQLSNAAGDVALSLEQDLAKRKTKKADEWFANNFDPEKSHHIDWLYKMHTDRGKEYTYFFNDDIKLRDAGVRYEALKKRFPKCKAVQWAENTPISGKSEQWNLLKGIPTSRIKILLEDILYPAHLWIPFAHEIEGLTGSVEVLQVEDYGYIFYHERKDSTIDLFFYRDSKIGLSFIWAQFESLKKKDPRELPILSMVDPDHKYEELKNSQTALYKELLSAYNIVKKVLMEKPCWDAYEVAKEVAISQSLLEDDGMLSPERWDNLYSDLTKNVN